VNGGPLESWRRRLPRLARAGRGASGAAVDAADGGRDGAVEGAGDTVPEARSPQVKGAAEGKGGAAGSGNGLGARVAGRTRPRSGAVGASTGTSVAGTRTVRAAAERPAGAMGPPRVPYSLQVAAAYAWRVLLVCAAVYVLYIVLLRFELVCIAVFLGLVFTSLLRPPVNALARYLPRSLSTLVTILTAIVVIAALFYLIGNSVAGESSRLASEFSGGLARIEKWLQGPPFHVSHATATGLQGKVSSFVSSHRSALISQALSGATRAVEILTTLALAVFCSVFFTHSGDRMWRWFRQQLPEGARPTWHRAGSAAWNTFAGYTRGVIIVAGTNALMVGISLYFLGVPLALPLTVLEFFASFIPLVGSPIAMAVATVVALAGRGVAIAAVVLVLIVVVGQIEGHVLQPLVMGWAVRLHPVVVAVSVIAGSIAAGLLGAVVAVPVVSIGWAVVKELRGPPDAGGEGADATPPELEPDPDADAVADVG
jgi:predicted PurR-regulated permease PerM